MYNVGTVTTTANSTKLIGVGTKWKDNNSRVSAEQVILIKSGTTVYINSIRSVQSNTELTLSFNSPVAVNAGTYEILTTMVNSFSDAANKIVAMNVANVQFSDILNRWATESGTITVTLPDGTTQQLRTAKEMDKQLDGKFDKTGGTISGDVTFSKDAIKSTKGTHTLPANSGTLMKVGDYGVGGVGPIFTDANELRLESGFYSGGGGETTAGNNFHSYSPLIHACRAGGADQLGMTLQLQGNTAKLLAYRQKSNGVWNGWFEIYSTGNTTKDSNGNLKAASPIVKVFADHIETNDESEGVEMEHLGVGH
ncbi:hypothetical protein ACS3HL_004257, partial [Providencia stuartii]